MILIAHGAMVEPALRSRAVPGRANSLPPYNPAEGEEWPPNLCCFDIAQHNANFFAGALGGDGH